MSISGRIKSAMSMLRLQRLLPLLGLVFATVTARADEPLFGYVYTTDILPKGKWEIEQWVTDRHKQSQGTYDNLKMRTEFEYGLLNDLQLALYLNYSWINANRNDVDGGTSGIDIPANHDPASPYNAIRYDGMSVELIWRVLSPYKDPLGLAFYIEPELGPRERALEARAIAQKNFLDDRLVLAANFWVEWERENIAADPFVPASDPAALGGIEKATMAELDLGMSYRFAPGWSAGVEYRNHNEFMGYSLAHSNQEHTAHFIGPNIHYATRGWFATLTVLKQIKAHPYTDEQRAVTVGDRIYGDEHTLYDGIRLKVGFVF
jgi:hypothetical protein